MPTLSSACFLSWALANSRCVPNLKSLAPAVAEILQGNPAILGSSPSPRPWPLFPLGVILWWALANSCCVPNSKSLASAVAEIIKGKPQMLGSSPSPGPHPNFLLVGFRDGPKETAAAGQIWSRWLHVLRKYNLFLNDKFAFWLTLWGVRGNVRTSSIALWKARGRLPVRDNWIFLLALTTDALIRRKRLYWRGWVTLGLNIRLKGYIYPQHVYTVR